MCGIAGYLGTQPPPNERMNRCLDLMQRRGPDAQGTYRQAIGNDRHVVLLHSRLSIIDLDERSNQPFCLEQDVLVYNGEIYNYPEVRDSLESRVPFETTGDTEVLLRALQAMGPAALDRCEGMWAFAWFNGVRGELVLSRDRFGEKPLYLLHDGDGLYFGSEVKFIAALRGRSLTPNRDQLCRYMVNGYKALYKTDATFFEEIEELSPGHTLTVSRDGHCNTQPYWLPRPGQDQSMSYADAVAGARERLIESVRLRLRADVPLAFCMSGGIDSNSLICTAKRVFDYDVHGFTIQNVDARYEEQNEVEHVVNELGLKHTSVPVTTSTFLNNLRELIGQHDAPVATITYYAHWTLMKHIRDYGYKISVSGTAADELFTGYYDHHMFYLAGVHAEADLFREALHNWQTHVEPTVRNPCLKDPVRFVQNPGFRDHIFLNCDEFSSYFKTPWSEPFSEREFTPDVLRNRMLNELFHEATRVILHEDDLNAMYYSIENRSPFLDRQLFDFTCRIPSRHLIRNGAAKSVLREAMRGIVPDMILDNRRKVGFNAPIFSYLDVNDSDVRASLLDDGPIFEMVDKARIETLLDKPTLPNSESKFLFYFLNSKMFLEQFAA